MVKKASNSKNDHSPSTSVTSAKNPLTASNQYFSLTPLLYSIFCRINYGFLSLFCFQTELRVKSSEKMKKTTEESVVSERKKRPKSKSRPKLKLKKKTKIEAKMPKKPPTAFFYFL
ncbi:hypothetical protein Goshw_005976 [Gossypium schwendimanii]|uniref:Uncharacterized protein n=1 Tax=Gossypium schwendimanii TaxID=34291 RepID=A0A7J9L169_GOSSC|nr:hypothetical protein [Gossypium schwendimanii]